MSCELADFWTIAFGAISLFCGGFLFGLLLLAVVWSGREERP